MIMHPQSPNSPQLFKELYNLCPVRADKNMTVLYSNLVSYKTPEGLSIRTKQYLWTYSPVLIRFLVHLQLRFFMTCFSSPTRCMYVCCVCTSYVLLYSFDLIPLRLGWLSQELGWWSSQAFDECWVYSGSYVYPLSYYLCSSATVFQCCR